MIKSCGIVGGGIGGLTLANALLQRGILVEVFEKQSHFFPKHGAGFGFAPNGQHSLSFLGLGDKVKEIGHPLTQHVMYDRHMKEPMAISDAFGRIQKKYGYALAGTLRADLVDILKEPLEAGKHIQYSQMVTDVTQNDGAATLHFENGSSRDFDLVVGADGVNSITIQKAFPEQHRDNPVYSNENIFYGVLENGLSMNFKNRYLGQPNTIVQNYGVYGEFISFPAGNDTIVWAQTYRGKMPEAGEWGAGEQAQKALEDFIEKETKNHRMRQDHPIHELFAATPQDRLMHFGLLYRKEKPVWHNGRVCLLGDSCHATLPHIGQGANLAIEDAIVLSQELCQIGDLDHALQRYFNRRFTRTKRLVRTAKTISDVAHIDSNFRAMITDFLLKKAIESGVLLKVATKEILEECPVPLKDLDPSIKFDL